MIWKGLVWFDMVWFGLIWFGMVWFDRGGRGMFGNVLEYSRTFLETPKSFMGGWVVVVVVYSNYSVYSGPDLLNLRQRLSWKGPGRHLELTWRWSGPELDNFKLNFPLTSSSSSLTYTPLSPLYPQCVWSAHLLVSSCHNSFSKCLVVVQSRKIYCNL